MRSSSWPRRRSVIDRLWTALKSGSLPSRSRLDSLHPLPRLGEGVKALVEQEALGLNDALVVATRGREVHARHRRPELRIARKLQHPRRQLVDVIAWNKSLGWQQLRDSPYRGTDTRQTSRHRLDHRSRHSLGPRRKNEQVRGIELPADRFARGKLA